MLSIERHEKILSLIKQKEKLTIVELSKILHVSLNTVRTDVAILEKKGILVRVHGGIALPISNLNAPVNEIGARYLKNMSEKRLIAQLAVQELYDGNFQNIFMDSSTSTMLVAEELYQGQKPYTIITNFVNIAQIFSLHSTIKVILCGGEWWGQENCTIGSYAVETIAQYQADVAFIGCTSLDINNGISNAVIETVPIKQEMIKNTKKTWLLCDSSKFDQKSLMKIFNLSVIDAIFTDKEPLNDWKTYCKTSAVQLYFPK